MTAIRTFFKRTVGQHSSNNNNLSIGSVNTDSSSETSSSSTTERLNNQPNDGYSSTSTLGGLTVNSDDSMRRPLLHVHSTHRRKKFFSRLINNTSEMDTQQVQSVDENICLLDKKLPKELILR
jgi:hypothetical protein